MLVFGLESCSVCKVKNRKEAQRGEQGLMVLKEDCILFGKPCAAGAGWSLCLLHASAIYLHSTPQHKRPEREHKLSCTQKEVTASNYRCATLTHTQLSNRARSPGKLNQGVKFAFFLIMNSYLQQTKNKLKLTWGNIWSVPHYLKCI